MPFALASNRILNVVKVTIKKRRKRCSCLMTKKLHRHVALPLRLFLFIRFPISYDYCRSWYCRTMIKADKDYDYDVFIFCEAMNIIEVIITERCGKKETTLVPKITCFVPTHVKKDLKKGKCDRLRRDSEPFSAIMGKFVFCSLFLCLCLRDFSLS